MTNLSTDNGIISLEEFERLQVIVEAISTAEGGSYTLEAVDFHEYPEYRTTFVSSCDLVYSEARVNYSEVRRHFDLHYNSEAIIVGTAILDACRGLDLDKQVAEMKRITEKLQTL